MYRFYEQALQTLQDNDCKVGDIIQAFNKEVIKNGVCPTITTRVDGLKTSILPVVEGDKEMGKKYAIRKLTENETWRLMGFSDEDFNKAAKVNSKSQLYKQSGNSIVVQVLMAIFLQLGIQGKKRWNDMSVEERQKLVDSSLDFLEK